MVKRARLRKAGRELAEEATQVLSKELADQQQGGGAQALGEDDLFVLDVQPDAAQTHVVTRPRKRKRASKEPRLTRAQLILQAGSQDARPMGTGAAYAPKAKKAAQCSSALVVRRPSRRQEIAVACAEQADAWAEKEAPAEWVPEERRLVTRPRRVDEPNRPQIAAVEVDAAGCSYNPEFSEHQEAVAAAVAHETQKLLDRELEPKAPPATVDERDLAFTEMASGLFSEDDDSDHDATAALEGTGGGTAAVKARRCKAKKDAAKEERRKAQAKALAEKRALKAQRRDVDAARQLQRDIEEESAQQELRRQRREADLADKAMHEPPRLGRHRFQGERPQVLASDDVTGSLRALRTVPAVAKDRFKSLQKRGVIQVTVQQHWQKPTTRRVKQYEKKATQEAHTLQQEEIDGMRRQRKKARAASRVR